MGLQNLTVSWRAARCLPRRRDEHFDAAEKVTASVENSHPSIDASRQEPAGLLVPLRNFDGTRKLSPRFPFGFLSRCSAPKPIKASLGFFDESYLFCSSLRGDSGGPSVAVWGSGLAPFLDGSSLLRPCTAVPACSLLAPSSSFASLRRARGKLALN